MPISFRPASTVRVTAAVATVAAVALVVTLTTIGRDGATASGPTKVALPTSALSNSGSSQPLIATKASSPRAAVAVKIRTNGTIVAPHRIRPGKIDFNVHGADGRRILLFQPRAAQGKTRLAKDINTFLKSATAVDLEQDFKILGGASIGHHLWVKLPAGTYFALVPSTKTLKASAIHRFVVSGAVANATVPPASATITVQASKRWPAKPKSIAHTGDLRLTNSSAVTHELYLAKLKPHKTRADVQRQLAKKDPALNKVFTGSFIEAGAVSPRKTELLSYDLPRGRYMLLDFWPDSAGTPHAQSGMLREINLR